MKTAAVLEFRTLDWKINRLEELRDRAIALQEEEEALIDEAFRITGEKYENGHTWNFMTNGIGKSAEELFAELERNPSDRWEIMDTLKSMF